VMVSSNSIATALGISSPPSEGAKLLQAYDGTRPAMVRLLQGLIHNKDKITDALVDRRQTAATRPGALETFKASEASIRAVRTDPILAANYDMRVTLPLLSKQIPSAFIWGENDIFAVPEIGRQVEKLLPDVTFHWLQGAGHQAQTDQPEAVAEIVHNLISKNARVAAPA